MQNRFGLLDTDVMPIFMIIALDIVITLYQLLGSNLFTHRIIFRYTNFAIFYFPIYKPKIPKILTLPFIYLYQISLLQVTVKGLTTPLSRWVQVGVCLCRYSVA